MNLQDVSDFIDLVKNPAKYEKVLQNLKEEQARLNAAVETIGKASELDKLRKETEQRQQLLQSEFDNLVSVQEQRVEQEVTILAQRKKELDEALERAAKALSEANTKQKEATELKDSFTGRDKALRQAEEDLAKRQKQFDVDYADLQNRLLKLRSVMG